MAQVSRIGRGTNLRSTTSRKVTFAVGLVCVLLAALLTTMSPSASAATSATPITDFVNYPNVPTAQIPASCPATGPGVLQNVNFDVLHNGTTTSANDLSGFNLVIGDKITMTWAGFTPGYENLRDQPLRIKGHAAPDVRRAR